MHIRLVRMSGPRMTLAPKWWRWWEQRHPRLERRPIRREIGIPIGKHWEVQFTWYA
jgi:hypothetical protein